jgi:8-oxo-dGTP pyrophosphatase MutT (NUDIX family)
MAAPDAFDAPLRERVRRNLARFEAQPVEDPALRRAAVACTLVDDAQGRPCFLLTRRAPRLRNHGGQWALPGGRVDPGESVEQAALRELHEELGVELGPESILGALDDYPTRSGFRITPFVVWAGSGVALAPDPTEVAAAYRVPLAVLDEPDVPSFHRIPESERPVVTVPIAMVRTAIHAPTAAILYQLRDVALRGLETRVAHLEQPVFAWR